MPANAKTIPLEVRFWNKVDRRGQDECWPWIGCRDAKGYGSLWGGSERRHRKATQISWEIANGQPFPAGKMACHTCDNPPCVNPAHIWPGTMSENIRDAVAKGRHKPSPGPFHNALKTHCKRGHELSGWNLLPHKSGRGCRICTQASKRDYSARRRQTTLTKRQADTLRELAINDGKNWCFWARPVSCSELAEKGLAEQYTPPSVAERPRMKVRPYRITEAGRSALQTGGKEHG